MDLIGDYGSTDDGSDNGSGSVDDAPPTTMEGGSGEGDSGGTGDVAGDGLDEIMAHHGSSGGGTNDGCDDEEVAMIMESAGSGGGGDDMDVELDGLGGGGETGAGAAHSTDAGTYSAAPQVRGRAALQRTLKMH
jgi:hypothetical protein